MRKFSDVLLPLLLATAFLACGGREQGTVTLSGWTASPVEEQLLLKIVAEFEAGHPGMKVVYEPIPGNYMDKIQLMLATRTAPDVFYLESFYAPAMTSYDVLEPLDEYIRRDSVDFADFEPPLSGAFQFRGRTYGMVKDYTTIGLFYNPELLSAAGITGPPKTWEEFRTACRRLTKDTNGDGKVDQWGFCMDPSLEYLLPFVYQNGGAFFAPDDSTVAVLDPPFMEALSFLVELYKDGYEVLPSDVGAGWSADAFGRGNIGMICSGNFAIPFLEHNYPDTRFAIAELPAHKEKATLAFTVGYVIPKHCQNKEQAWELLKYLTSVEGMTKWTALGLALPPRRSVVKINQFDADPLRKPLINGAAYARPWQLSESYRILDETQSSLQRIFLTSTTVEAEMTDLKQRVERVMHQHEDLQ